MKTTDSHKELAIFSRETTNHTHTHTHTRAVN